MERLRKVACPVGTWRDQKSFKCIPCGKGSYQDNEGQASCKECDEGKSTESLGATSSEDCVEVTPKVPSEEKDIIGLIVGLVVALLVLVAIIAIGYRYRRHCCFDRPVLQENSCRYKGGHSNKGFDGDKMHLEKRGSNSLEEDTESSDGKEPVYWTIPEKKENAYDNSDANRSDYQLLNTANRRSNALYAKINHPDPPYDISTAQSVV